MKNIRKLLREQSKNVLPDESVQENIRRELGLENAERSAAYAHGGTAAHGGRQKTIIALAAVLLAAALFLAVFLPIFLNRGTGKPTISNGKFSQIVTAEDFYMYSAVSVGAVLSSRQNGALGYAQPVAAKAFGAARVLTGEQQTIADTVERYMALADGLLGQGEFEHTVPQAHEDAAFAGFEYKTVITYVDSLGHSAPYTLYFNKTQLEYEADGEETEEEYSLEGVLVLDGEIYPVEGHGENESEAEEDESGQESEMQFIAYLSEDEKSYIRVHREFETETEQGEEPQIEQKYIYSTFISGKETEKTTVEYESEGEELELLMIVETGGVKDELLFRRAAGAKNTFNVRAKIEGREYRFTVSLQEGGYVFDFSESLPGGGDDDDDDDDDD